MKLLLCSLVALAYGENSGADYIRVDIIGSGHANTGAAGTGCTGTVTRSILVKPIKSGHVVTQNVTHPTMWSNNNDRFGSCVNFDLNTDDPNMFDGTAFDLSFALLEGATGIYNSVSYAGADCTVVGAVEASGFVFDPAETGAHDCSGVTSPADDAGGLIIVASNQAIVAKGTLFLNSRALIGQLSGPFNNTTCTTLNTVTASSYPIVIPLVSATAAPTDFSESAISTTGICTSWGTAAATHLMRAKTTATPGELVFEISTTSAVFTNRTTCVNGSAYMAIKFTADAHGAFTQCVNAVDENNAAIANHFFKFNPDGESIGEWPTWPEAPTAAPTEGTTSPATTLHLSATMAALFGLIAMMM